MPQVDHDHVRKQQGRIPNDAALIGSIDDPPLDIDPFWEGSELLFPDPLDPYALTNMGGSGDIGPGPLEPDSTGTGPGLSMEGFPNGEIVNKNKKGKITRGRKKITTNPGNEDKPPDEIPQAQTAVTNLFGWVSKAPDTGPGIMAELPSSSMIPRTSGKDGPRKRGRPRSTKKPLLSPADRKQTPNLYSVLKGAVNDATKGPGLSSPPLDAIAVSTSELLPDAPGFNGEYSWMNEQRGKKRKGAQLRKIVSPTLMSSPRVPGHSSVPVIASIASNPALMASLGVKMENNSHNNNNNRHGFPPTGGDGGNVKLPLFQLRRFDDPFSSYHSPSIASMGPPTAPLLDRLEPATDAILSTERMFEDAQEYFMDDLFQELLVDTNQAELGASNDLGAASETNGVNIGVDRRLDINSSSLLHNGFDNLSA